MNAQREVLKTMGIRLRQFQYPVSELNELGEYLTDEGWELLLSLPDKELDAVNKWWKRNRPAPCPCCGLRKHDA